MQLNQQNSLWIGSLHEWRSWQPTQLYVMERGVQPEYNTRAADVLQGEKQGSFQVTATRQVGRTEIAEGCKFCVPINALLP